MKILSKYLFLGLLKPLLYLTATFCLLFIIGDLMDNGSDFLDHKTPLIQIVYYYSLFLPSAIIHIIPICLLLATLYSLSMLTRYSEIIAMRASGISIYHILQPYMVMAVICCLFVGLINEYFSPRFSYMADQFIKTLELNDNAYFQQIAYINPKTKDDWYIQKFDTRSYKMEGIQLSVMDNEGHEKTRYIAEQAEWLDGRWWFKKVTIQKFNTNGHQIGKPQKIPLKEMRNNVETPFDFLNVTKESRYLSASELLDFIKTHSKTISYKQLIAKKVDFHYKLTQPFTCILIILIGIPIGAQTGRRGAFAGIMTTLLLFFGFYIIQFTMIYLAKNLFVFAWTGPWTALLFFSLIGSIMIHRMR